MEEMWDRSLAPQVWIQYHNQLATYRSILQGRGVSRVLDVGCAQATLALLLAEDGHEVTAVDIRPQFLEYAASRVEKGRIRFVCGNVLEMECPGRFDVVFCNQLIEHLVYPEKLVSRLAEWLDPGGLLVVTTPNGRYLMNALPSYGSISDRTALEGRQFTADADGHFFAYRPAELEAVFLGSGFDRVVLRFFETPWVSGHMKVRYIQGIVGDMGCRWLDRLSLAIPGWRQLVSHQLMALGWRALSR
jgi:SAM-dependent methyltransferase